MEKFPIVALLIAASYVDLQLVPVPCRPNLNSNSNEKTCNCYDILDDQCLRANSTLKKCDPNTFKPCEDCFFCKKDKDGVFRCHPVNKENVKSMDDVKAIIRNFEGLLLEVKNVNKKKSEKSIGYGFHLGRPGAKEDFKKALPDVDFDKVLQGKVKITREQALKLFNHDFDKIFLPRAEKAIGKVWNGLPFNKKFAIINGFYRGDIGPKTIALIKKKKWTEASVEYLNHTGYRNAKDNKMGGIVKRMDCNAKQLKD